MWKKKLTKTVWLQLNNARCKCKLSFLEFKVYNLCNVYSKLSFGVCLMSLDMIRSDACPADTVRLKIKC